MTRIEEIKERESKATEGPYEFSETEEAVAIGMKLGTRHYPLMVIAKSTVTELPYEFGPTFKFFAHSRTDIPYLTKAVEEARPVMEWAAQQKCRRLNSWTECSECVPHQARAWKKEYFPEVKS